MTISKRMGDPSREELLAMLFNHWGRDVADEPGIAIYWFIHNWQGGQATNLYAVLCRSPCEPGPINRPETEGERVLAMIEALEAAFGQPASDAG